MKKILLAFFAFWLFHFLLFSQTKNTFSELDRRINNPISPMTIKEKVEHWYYYTDSCACLGILRFTGSGISRGIGNKTKGCSCFPVTIAVAADWSRPLILSSGQAISLEQAARKRFRIAGPKVRPAKDQSRICFGL
ncbi:hypothetical protein ACRQ5D_21960 [Mucilaginibacter sp. P25]|nr:hypothetical protein [Mucilaginibacter gossypii]